jgi:hypothetical protein
LWLFDPLLGLTRVVMQLNKTFRSCFLLLALVGVWALLHHPIHAAEESEHCSSPCALCVSHQGAVDLPASIPAVPEAISCSEAPSIGGDYPLPLTADRQSPPSLRGPPILH